MHIFNLNNKAHLIISTHDISFPESTKDASLQRVKFDEIKKVSIIHRYGPDKELFIWLKIALKQQGQDYLVQISALDMPLEEIFDTLREQLSGKCKLTLPKNTFLHTLRTRHKTYKLSFLLVSVLLLGLLAFHKFYPPKLIYLKTESLKVKSLKPSSLCSAHAIVAYPSQKKEETTVKTYCGILSTWSLSSTKQIPTVHLETEFSSLKVRDYLINATKKIQTNELEEALIEVDKAMYLDKNSEATHTLLSKIYALQGNDAKALDIAKKAISLKESSASAHYNISLLYLKKEALEKAHIHLLRSCELEPRAEVYIKLAQVEKSLNLHDKALQHYENSLDLDPNNAYIWTEVGLSYWNKKDFIQTEYALNKAYKLHPDNAYYFLNYYEVSLVHPSDINISTHEHFVVLHKNDVKSILTYEMLKVIELSIKNLDTEKAKKLWLKKFDGEPLQWSFDEIRFWLDESDLGIDHKQNIQSTIGFFIGYQQAYKMSHPELNTQKVVP